MVQQGLAMLACERVGDKFWLAADLQEPCMEGRHLGNVFAICIPQILLFVLGLPLGATILLYRNRKRLFNREIQIRWGLLYAGYRVEVFWWELTVVVRKISLVVVGGVFGARLGPDMQVYMALAMIVVFLVLHLGVRPFDELTKTHRILHWLELGGLMVCWGTLYCGMLFWIGNRLPSGLRVFVSISIVGGNTCFTVFVSVVYIRSVIRERKKGSQQSAKRLQSKLRNRLSQVAGESKLSHTPSELSHHIEMTNSFVENPLKTPAKPVEEQEAQPETSTRKFKQYETADGQVYFVEVDTQNSVWYLPEDGELLE
jgi:hypothetical protein